MNRRTILIVFIFLVNFQGVLGQGFIHPKKSDYPNLPKYGKSIDDFVPKNWETVGKALGDLNGDKIEDCVLVIKANYSQFLNKHDGLGSDPFDTNPRILTILFKDKNGYRIAKQSNTFVIIPEFPAMDDPFEEVKIRNNVLQINFDLFFSAGSWATYQYSYKFKFLNGEFVLIGADRTESMRNSGETQSQSYNFLTKKMKITTGNFASADKTKIKWKTFNLKKLKTLDTFKEPLSWKIHPDYNL